MLRRPISWREMDRLRRDMDRLFETTYRGLPRWQGANFPQLNIWTNDEEGAIVTAELPGVTPDDLEIEVTGDTLTLKGKRTPDEADSSSTYHRRERMVGEFTRTVQLPYTVDKDNVEASLNSGVLQINLPRAEDEKPRKITIGANGR